jgi:branched-chain amino acid transport system permease protein
MSKKDLYTLAFLIAGIVIFALFMAGDQYTISLLVFLGINAIITLGLSLLMGYAGQISLGHAAFFGIGAYSSGVLTTKYSWPPVAAFFVGLFLAGAVAFVVGKPTLRLKGHYMAVATLGFGEIMFIIFNELSPLTGGPSGLSGIPSLALGDVVIEGSRYLILVWVLLIFLLVFSLNVINSRVGRALRAVHGSEVAANAMGIDASRYKVQVFVLSAVYASMAGSLYAHFVTFISPNAFSVMFSILLLMMAVVGGMGTVWGALLGTAVLTFLPEQLRGLEDMEVLAYGAILMFFLLFMPHGILQEIQKIFPRKRNLRVGGA